MKKYLKIIFGILILSLSLSSCDLKYKKGNGNVTLNEHELHEFRKINIGGDYNVKLFKAENNFIRIEADENLMSYINIEEKDSTLFVNSIHNLKSSKGINIEIYYVRLEELNSTGFSSIENIGTLKTDRILINLSGAGAIKLDVDTDWIGLNMSGAGAITLTGESGKMDCHIAGAGGLQAFGLECIDGKVNISGIGGAEVNVSNKLDAVISGLGGITYIGEPALIEKQVSGLGAVEKEE